MEQTVQTETTTQTTKPVSMLMTTLMALVENYINDIVQKQVAEIMVSHETMRVIDRDFEKQVRDIVGDVIDDAISNHCDAEYHISESDIDDTVSTAINDYDFDDKVNDAVTSAIDQLDLTEMIRTEIKDNITFSVSVD